MAVPDMNTATIKLSSPATREFWEIPVLYEDAQLLALSKPPRMLTSADRDNPERPNLMKLLHQGVTEAKSWARERGLTYLMNAHRLDFDTSGVLLLAKTKPILIAVANLFGVETPQTTYVAVAQGVPAQATWTSNAPIAPVAGKPGLMRVSSQNGKACRTKFKILKKFAGWSLIECQPLPGRTHQIRLHLQHSGFPIAGDALYGGRPLLLSELKPSYRLKPGHTERPLLGTTALHAEKLSLPHPVTQEILTLTAPWPKDLTVALKYLQLYAGGTGA